MINSLDFMLLFLLGRYPGLERRTRGLKRKRDLDVQTSSRPAWEFLGSIEE